MTSLRQYTCVFIIAMCLAMTLARPHRSKHHRKPGFLVKLACEIRNVTDPTSEPIACGCRNVTDSSVDCDLGPITINDKFGNDLAVKFCDIPPAWDSDKPYRGVLGAACEIVSKDNSVIFKEARKCPRDAACLNDSSKALPVTINGTEALAYFCQEQLQQRSDRSHNMDSRSGEEDDENADNTDTLCGRRRGRKPGRPQGQGRSRNRATGHSVPRPDRRGREPNDDNNNVVGRSRNQRPNQDESGSDQQGQEEDSNAPQGQRRNAEEQRRRRPTGQRPPRNRRQG